MGDTTPEPLLDLDALNREINFYATLGHRSPAHAAVHFMFLHVRSGGALSAAPPASPEVVEAADLIEGAAPSADDDKGEKQ